MVNGRKPERFRQCLRPWPRFEDDAMLPDGVLASFLDHLNDHASLTLLVDADSSPYRRDDARKLVVLVQKNVRLWDSINIMLGLRNVSPWHNFATGELYCKRLDVDVALQSEAGRIKSLFPLLQFDRKISWPLTLLTMRFVKYDPTGNLDVPPALVDYAGLLGTA